VNNSCFAAPTGQRGLQLQKTARIARGHEVDVQRSNKLGFAVAQFVSSGGLHQVVDSSGATTDGCLGNFRDRQVGYPS